MSSTVTCRPGASRSGLSAPLRTTTLSQRRCIAAYRRCSRCRRLDAHDLQELVDARLEVDADRGLVTHEPGVIVNTAHGVEPVAGLDVEEVALERRGELLGGVEQEQRAVLAGGGKRRGGACVLRAIGVCEDE